LYNWAAENPQKVRCIAGIYPACNLTSYPGLAKACGAYGLTEDGLKETRHEHNPIDRLRPLAEAGVPIYHIHGDVDTVVPLEENSGLVAKRYRELGGAMTLEVPKGQGHNMWRGFFECQGLVDFVIQESKTPPNILFILIDDLHVQGNDAVHTPNIDRLASEGMRFTDNYAAAPVCSPTRAAILTGLSPARLAITNHLPDQARFTPDNPTLLPAKTREHLPLAHTTIAERLKANGYATGFLGKWHLSGPGKGTAEFEPTAQGFDFNVGGCGYGGPPTFFDPYRIPHLPSRREGDYLPERLADEAIDFMKTQLEAKNPFMLFLWNYTVHWPMEAPESLLEKYANHKGPGLNDS
ncbi:MAG: sulfatase-like hydrolase/transferase, partial [Verrucomicrobiales bacterium]